MGDDLINSKAMPASQVIYRCVCGVEKLIDPQQGGICDNCRRVISHEAIVLAMSVTLSINDLKGQPTVTAVPDTAEPDPLCNQLLGHFRLDCRLGSGGMGSVYRALDTSLQRYVAVKVLRSNATGSSAGSADPRQVTSLLQEAVAQARLNHPHVVTIYYVGRHQGEPFLAMELLSGETLSESIKRSPLPYSRVILTAIQVTEALKHATHFGIIHGDIKPSNLLVANDAHVKLSDFGLSQFSTVDVEGDRISGTPAYIAPELLQGARASVQSDMYSLGVTLFELTFNRLPYTVTTSPMQFFANPPTERSVAFPLPWPRDVPFDWLNVLQKLLATDPKDRYPNYDSLLVDLRRLMPVSNTPAAVAPRAMAYLLDQAMLLMFLSPFAFSLVAINQAEALQPYRILEPFVAACALIVPATYLFLVRHGWRTVGRYLFQLRVVDEHGLALPPGDRTIREFLRSMFAWLAPFAGYAGLYSPFVDTGIDGFMIAFLAVDILFLTLRRDGRALHDLLCHSRVVLAQST